MSTLFLLPDCFFDAVTIRAERSFWSLTIASNALPVCLLATGVAAIGSVGAFGRENAAAGLAHGITPLFQPPLPLVPPESLLGAVVVAVFLGMHSGIKEPAAASADDLPDRGNKVLRAAAETFLHKRLI